MLLVLALLAVTVLLVAAHGRSSDPGRGRAWLAGWAVAGALLAFAFVTGLSIGLFVLPLAFGALGFVAARARVWPEALGLLGGVGATCLLIAALNRAYEPCPAAGETTLGASQAASASCGGLSPVPWLFVGVVLLALSVGGYAIAGMAQAGRGGRVA
jgi:hypothetical protein